MGEAVGQLKISIHALREEGDFDSDTVISKVCKISIHALREEGDLPGAVGRRVCPALISIHALREEGDKTPR